MVVPTRTKINLGFGLALTFLAVISVFTYRELLRSIEAVRWVNHTHETLEQLTTVLPLVLEEETARGGWGNPYLTACFDRLPIAPESRRSA